MITELHEYIGAVQKMLIVYHESWGIISGLLYPSIHLTKIQAFFSGSGSVSFLHLNTVSKGQSGGKNSNQNAAGRT